MKKHVGYKVIGMLTILFIVFAINGLAQNLSSTNSKEAFIAMSDVYVNLEGKNTTLAVDVQKAKLFMNQFFLVTDPAKMADIITNCAANNEEIRSLLIEMETIAAQSDSQLLKDGLQGYSTLVLDFVATLETLADAVKAGDVEAAGRSGAALTEYYLSMEQAQKDFNATLVTVIDEVTAERVDAITRGNRLTVITFALFILFMMSNIFITTKFISTPAKNADKQLQEILKKLNNDEGDLTERITTKSNDEIGELIKGINGLLDKLQSTMSILKTETLNMNDSVNRITEGIIDSNENAVGVSAAMEELSASMQEVSATLSHVNEGVREVLDISKDMNEQAKQGAEFITDVKKKAQGIKEDTEQSKNSTVDMIRDIRSLLEVSITNSKNVNKINELTNEILNISSQTNLLALNASIEAARAGEAGRGFAVVADEIGKLASNSAETANNIQSISVMVTQAVEELSKNADDMLQFIDERVLVDYDKFVDVATQYHDDADDINQTLQHFYNSARHMENTMENMTNGIEGIATAVNESAEGVTVAAQNTGLLVAALGGIETEANANKGISELLSGEVSKFKYI
ncbi:MAG: methyl-accepting chemotaxis protein [Lachnospiraceae bacterium]|nr:methyl-accepting chemotaxis protein [Lachnospiraceae bacterium]